MHGILWIYSKICYKDFEYELSLQPEISQWRPVFIFLLWWIVTLSSYLTDSLRYQSNFTSEEQIVCMQACIFARTSLELSYKKKDYSKTTDCKTAYPRSQTKENKFKTVHFICWPYNNVCGGWLNLRIICKFQLISDSCLTFALIYFTSVLRFVAINRRKHCLWP